MSGKGQLSLQVTKPALLSLSLLWVSISPAPFNLLEFIPALEHAKPSHLLLIFNAVCWHDLGWNPGVARRCFNLSSHLSLAFLFSSSCVRNGRATECFINTSPSTWSGESLALGLEFPRGRDEALQGCSCPWGDAALSGGIP